MEPVTLTTFDLLVAGLDGKLYRAAACGRRRPDGKWEGWIEFVADDGDALRTGRETTQPNHLDLTYWASGLSPIYLEGALARAMRPVSVVVRAAPAPLFDGPADDVQTTVELPAADLPDPVLDPYEVWAEQGETVLRRQLHALAPWHLRNIARAFRVGPAVPVLATLSKPELVEILVDAARASVGGATAAR